MNIMEKFVVVIGRKRFVVSGDHYGIIYVVILTCHERGFSMITAEGKTAGENLVAACRESGLSYGDMVLIANRLKVSLAGSTGISNINFAFA